MSVIPAVFEEVGLSEDVRKRIGNLYIDPTEFVKDDDSGSIARGDSDVWKGRLIHSNKSTRVAYKRLHFIANKDSIKFFEREIYVWSKLKNGNILPLLGFTFTETPEGWYPCLLSPWMDNHTVTNYVRKRRDKNDEFNPFHLIVDIASGLSYLHDNNVIHSDIKGANIYVYENEKKESVAVIGDFGTTRMTAASLSVGRPSVPIEKLSKGTHRWIACELAVATLKSQPVVYTQAADVWAFGMTVYEILTGKVPYNEIQENDYIAQLRVLQLIDSGTVPIRPKICDEKEMEKFLFDEICSECWKHWDDPTKRISMSEILQKLSGSGFYVEAKKVHQSSEEDNSGIRVKCIKRYPTTDDLGKVYCIRFSGPGNGNYFALGYKDSIVCYDIGKKEKDSSWTYELKESFGDPEDQRLCFTSPTGDVALWYYGGTKFVIFDSESDTDTEEYNLGKDIISSLIYTNDDIACGLNEGRVCRIQLNKPDRLRLSHTDDPDQRTVTAMAISPNHTLIASSFSNIVQVWRLRRMQPLKHAKHSAEVTSIVFTSEEEIIIAGGKSIARWDISESVPCAPEKTSANEYSGEKVRSNILNAAVSHDLFWVLGFGEDGTVHFWHRDSYLYEKQWKHPNLPSGARVISVEFCQTSNKFATMTDKGNVEIWTYGA